ncbi:MAG TPA: hypothetical protein VH597_08640 [Verrucomicrobiae bacterium]|jgi:hypothetical protein|nr:hypothetical protein [Verrucomicrobiae bacterium]
MKILTTTTFVILSVSASAAPVVLDFEEFPNLSYGLGTFISENNRLSTQYLTTYGIKFSSELAPYVGVVTLGSGHATSGVNGLSGATASDTVTYSGTILIAEFFDPSNPTVKAVTDSFSVRGDEIPDGSGGTLSAYDVNGQLIAQQTISDVAGDTFLITAPGIHQVTFLGSGTIALDDVSFDPVTVTAAQPSLTILSVSPGSVSLLWPTNASDFSLQSNTNLASINWVTVSPLPVILGTNSVVTNAVSGESKFYRLFKP